MIVFLKLLNTMLHFLFSNFVIVLIIILPLKKVSGGLPDTVLISQLPGFISTVIVLGIAPEEIFDWLRQMDNRQFLAWHPAHVEYRKVKETADYVGSRIFFHEEISGYSISGTWKVIEVIPPTSITFKKIWQPVYWKLTLSLVENEGTLVQNEMRYGTGWRWLDGILDKAVQRWFLKPEIQKAIDEHDREEFLMLGNLINK